MRLNLRKQGGFTLIEVTIILLVLVILSTIMLPQMGNFNRLARFVKAKEDLTAICASAKKMLDEVMLGTFYQTPNGSDHQIAPASPVGLLVGPGAPPTIGSVANDAASQGTKTNVSGAGWYAAVGPTNDCIVIVEDTGTGEVSFDCDFLQNHLQTNDPFGDDSASALTRYKNHFDGVNGGTQHPGLQNAMIGGIFGWRGPYLDSLTPDPWGGRYAVNSFALYSGPGGAGGVAFYSSATVCYSAGPDLGNDTKFNQAQNGATGGGWLTGGDDLAVILSAYGPF